MPAGGSGGVVLPLFCSLQKPFSGIIEAEISLIGPFRFLGPLLKDTKMEYRTFGTSNIKVSRLCLGCMSFGFPTWRPWVLEEHSSDAIFRKSVELGINFFDTANIYSDGESERILGRAIKKYLNRSDTIISSKVGIPTNNNDRPLSRDSLRHSIDTTLKNLGTDYVDIYLIHRFDYNTPIEETLEELNAIVAAGKVRTIGASSMYAWQFSKLLFLSDKCKYQRPSMMQLQYSLVYREEEREMIPLCASEAVNVVSWAPLARGFLARNPKANITLRMADDRVTPALHNTIADVCIREVISEIATERQVPPATIALSWVLQNPLITSAVIGASNANQVGEADLAISTILSDDEVNRLAKQYVPRAVLDHK